LDFVLDFISNSCNPESPTQRALFGLKTLECFLNAWRKAFPQLESDQNTLSFVTQRLFSHSLTLQLLSMLVTDRDLVRPLVASILSDFPAPLPGIDPTSENLKYFLDLSLSLVGESRFRKAQSGALLLSLLFEKYRETLSVPVSSVSDHKMTDVPLYLCSQILALLEGDQKQEDRTPLHGYLASLRKLWIQLPPEVRSTPELSQLWDIGFRVIEEDGQYLSSLFPGFRCLIGFYPIYLPPDDQSSHITPTNLVNDDESEGEDSDTENEEGQEDLLSQGASSAWLSLREAAELLADIAQFQLKTEKTMFHHEKTRKLIELLFEILVITRHNGVIQKIHLSLIRIITSHLNALAALDDSSEIVHLSEKWQAKLFQFLEIAGLPP